MQTLVTRRYLGFAETMEHEASTYLPDVSNQAGIIKLEGLIDNDNLLKSLKSIFASRLLLRSRLQYDNTRHKYYFEPDVSFSEILIRHESSILPKTIDNIITEEIDTPIPPDKYLWKFASINNKKQNTCYLILTCHHSIIDGVCFLMLAHHLAEIYHEQNADYSTINTKCVESAEQLLTGMEKYTDDSIDNASIAKMPQNSENATRQLKFAKKVPPSERRSEWIDKALQNDIVTELKHLCKIKNISFTALLCAATTHCSRMLIQQYPAKIRLHIPFDLRRYASTNIANDELGVYASCISQDIILNEKAPTDELLTIAQEIEKQTPSLIKRNLANTRSEFDIFEDVHRPLKELAKQTLDAFPLDFINSNLGKFDFKKLERLKKISINGCRRPAEFVFVINSFFYDEQLNLNFGSTAPLLDKETMHNFVETYINSLISCI